MDSSSVGVPSHFADRILRLLERVEHRVAKTEDEREAVFRMRYDAYLRNGLLTARADRRLYDPRYDDASNARLVMTFVDGELAGSVRMNLASSLNDPFPALGVYPEVVTPHLRAGRVLVEMTRTAGTSELESLAGELPYITLRPGYLAAEHFHADYVIATPRAPHMAFFRRVFGFELWCEPREYPGLTAKFGCMGADCSAVEQRVISRYPFFRSTVAEREALFGPAPPRRPAARRPEYESHVGT